MHIHHLPPPPPQGPYSYALYAFYGFEQGDIALLYMGGFLSSMVRLHDRLPCLPCPACVCEPICM